MVTGVIVFLLWFLLSKLFDLGRGENSLYGFALLLIGNSEVSLEI